MPFAFTCHQCGADFLRHTQTRSAGGVYCSRECYWLSMRKNYPERICVSCGSPFDPRMGGRTSRLDRDHCTWGCYNDARRQRLSLWIERQNGTGCWPWPFGLNKDGYGVTSGGRGQLLVHRAVWIMVNGPISGALTVDHMCHNLDTNCTGGRSCPHRRCANPADLALAESAENTLRGNGPGAINARKTHCIRDHPLSGDNLYTTPAGFRQCRRCQAEREKAYRITRHAIPGLRRS